MTEENPAPEAVDRPIDWWSRPSLRLHAVLVLGLAGCAVASVIEWRRALSGHTLAWVYAFEWPLFAVVGTWVWWRLLRGDDRPTHRRDAAPTAESDVPDVGLIAWQDYLDRLHAADAARGAATPES